MNPKPMYANPIICSTHLTHARGSGYSTMLALNTLTTAIANPEIPVLITDHFVESKGGVMLQIEAIESVCRTLGIKARVSLSELTVTAERIGATKAIYVKR